MSDNSKPLILLPGDDVTAIIAEKSSNNKALIGPGLKREENNRIVVVKCGQFINRNNTNFWMDSHQKRYIACKADKVIGVVVSKQAYSAKVDIGTNETATLSLLAFPNATKRNKAQIEVCCLESQHFILDLHILKLLFGPSDRSGTPSTPLLSPIVRTSNRS